jgi:hypothetical protein
MDPSVSGEEVEYYHRDFSTQDSLAFNHQIISKPLQAYTTWKLVHDSNELSEDYEQISTSIIPSPPNFFYLQSSLTFANLDAVLNITNFDKEVSSIKDDKLFSYTIINDTTGGLVEYLQWRLPKSLGFGTSSIPNEIVDLTRFVRPYGNEDVPTLVKQTYSFKTELSIGLFGKTQNKWRQILEILSDLCQTTRQQGIICLSIPIPNNTLGKHLCYWLSTCCDTIALTRLISTPTVDDTVFLVGVGYLGSSNWKNLSSLASSSSLSENSALFNNLPSHFESWFNKQMNNILSGMTRLETIISKRMSEGVSTPTDVGTFFASSWNV